MYYSEEFPGTLWWNILLSKTSLRYTELTHCLKLWFSFFSFFNPPIATAASGAETDWISPASVIGCQYPLPAEMLSVKEVPIFSPVAPDQIQKKRNKRQTWEMSSAKTGKCFLDKMRHQPTPSAAQDLLLVWLCWVIYLIALGLMSQGTQSNFSLFCHQQIRP